MQRSNPRWFIYTCVTEGCDSHNVNTSLITLCSRLVGNRFVVYLVVNGGYQLKVLRCELHNGECATTCVATTPLEERTCSCTEMRALVCDMAETLGFNGIMWVDPDDDFDLSPVDVAKVTDTDTVYYPVHYEERAGHRVFITRLPPWFRVGPATAQLVFFPLQRVREACDRTAGSNSGEDIMSGLNCAGCRSIFLRSSSYTWLVDDSRLYEKYIIDERFREAFDYIDNHNVYSHYAASLS